MGKLILLRHGESVWNKKNIFTGWVNVSLSAEGVAEALAAGEKIKAIDFDVVFVSALVRAQTTGFLALSKGKKVPVLLSDDEPEWERVHSTESAQEILPVYFSSALNERYYGKLQGKNKTQVKAEVGEDQFKLWRRSFDVPPPEGESLKMTIERAMPYFNGRIFPEVESGKNVLISAHGNSLRGIIMELDKLSPEEVIHLEIPTGQPILYTFESGEWKRGKI